MDLTVLLYKNGYPPEWNDEVFERIMEQAENFKKWHSDMASNTTDDAQVNVSDKLRHIYKNDKEDLLMAADDAAPPFKRSGAGGVD